MSTLLLIPPLPEQHRIAAKVDQLVAICHDLQSRLRESQAVQVQLSEAVVLRAVGLVKKH